MSSLRGGGGIFISYRREETAANAGRLYDHLSDHFGGDRVFMDVDSIAIGSDFTKAITEAVSGCGILLALIGRHWSAVTDVKGIRRIDYPQDFVRIEIETALQQDIRVVPVLVDGAVLPQAADLPPSLRPLIQRQALQLSHAGFRSEVSHLIAAIDEVLGAGRVRSAEVPTARRQGTVTRQGGWQLELVADEGKKKTFRLSSRGETHDITLIWGIYKDMIEVDGQLEVKTFGRNMYPYPLRSLSSALGSDVTMQYATERNLKVCTVRVVVLKIGGQVVRYEVGSPVAGGWRLELLTDAGAKKTFRLSSGQEIHNITIYLAFRKMDVIEVDGTREVVDGLINNKTFFLRGLSSDLGFDVTIQVKTGNVAWERIKTLTLKIDDHVLTYDSGIA
jgi:hypothetical protein